MCNFVVELLTKRIFYTPANCIQRKAKMIAITVQGLSYVILSWVPFVIITLLCNLF